MSPKNEFPRIMKIFSCRPRCRLSSAEHNWSHKKFNLVCFLHCAPYNGCLFFFIPKVHPSIIQVCYNKKVLL